MVPSWFFHQNCSFRYGNIKQSFHLSPCPKKPNHLSPWAFFKRLRWIDGRSLTEIIEPYRRRLFEQAFMTLDARGRRQFNVVVKGVAKKNYKSTDLIPGSLYCLIAVDSVQGNDCFVVANDEDQAADDLALAKKIIAANRMLADAVDVQQKQITRCDRRGALRILPAGDALGMHGKTWLFRGIDEMHGYRNYDVLEALAPDPTRPDAMTWITSYASMYNTPGAPLFDYFQRGVRGDDPHMLFSWFSADYCNDAEFAVLPPEHKANPSMASWDNDDYLEQQRQRLPAHTFRRLHLNLPGMPDGAYFSPTHIRDAIAEGRREYVVPKDDTIVRDLWFVDMSGGSSDFSVLARAVQHRDTGTTTLAQPITQTGRPPFDPHAAVVKFAGLIKASGHAQVTGDAYGGNIFKAAFAAQGVSYVVSQLNKHQIYESFEPLLNSGRVDLLDDPELQEQLLGLVMRGHKIDHMTGEHDDSANAAAGAIVHASRPPELPNQVGVIFSQATTDWNRAMNHTRERSMDALDFLGRNDVEPGY